MDSYQAVYDAVRSRISGGNVGDAVYRAAIECFDLGHFRAQLTEQMYVTAQEMQRPSVLFRPKIMADGTMWIALLGDNIQEGIAGCGHTPSEAMADFDKQFQNARTPEAERRLRIEERRDEDALGVGA